jgi:Fe2+ transport system protein FeoA
MAERVLTCPLCAFEFKRVDTICRHGCPLSSICNLVRCPSCAYEFPETPPQRSWFARLVRPNDDGRPEASCETVSVEKLAAGETAHVVCVAGQPDDRRNTLAVFGVTPGSEITLIQHRPSCVLRVGETELALDTDIAQRILVMREEAAPGARS